MKKPKLITPKEITAINLRHNLGEILDQVTNKHERFLVKRAGIPAAILLSVPDYKDLEELVDTWYEQQDPTFQESLVKARQEIEEGKIVTLEGLAIAQHLSAMVPTTKLFCRPCRRYGQAFQSK